MKITFYLNKKRGIIYIMAFLICFPSFVAGGQADKWILYYTATDGSKYFYDMQSIIQTPKTLTATDKKPTVRSRQKNKKAWMVKVKEKIIFNGPDYELSESKMLREFDCSTKKVHILMRTNFYKNGTLQVKGKMGIWQGIDSEPQLETLYNIVCPS
jgi:Surface-adhesin protein E